MAANPLIVALVSSFAALLYGFNIGFVGPTLYYEQEITKCDSFRGEAACTGVKRAGCKWFEDTCVYGDQIWCGAGWHNESSCKAVSSHCFWDYSNKKCAHDHGWSDLQQGMFSSSMIFGCMVSSLSASIILWHLGRKRTLLVCSLLCLVATTAFVIAWNFHSYPVMVVSRVVLGLGIGVLTVGCPMYVEEMAPKEHKGKIELLFQMGITLGIVLAALVGLVNAPDNTAAANQHLEARFQTMPGIGLFFSVVVIGMSVVMPESDLWIDQRNAARLAAANSQSVQKEESSLDDRQVESQRTDRAPDDLKRPLTKVELLRYSAISVSLALVLQFTGINAVMNYAPTLAKSMGLHPMLGNFIIMTWNFVSTLPAPAVGKKLPATKAYLIGGVLASAGCLLVGIPTLPHVVENTTVRHTVAMVGMAIFVAMFELLIGTFFYPIAAGVFPSQIRSKGCSATLLWQFVFNVIINQFFPTLVTAISGGKSADQNKGIGVMFILFATFGFVFSGALFLLLPKPQSSEAVDAEETDDLIARN